MKTKSLLSFLFLTFAAKKASAQEPTPTETPVDTEAPAQTPGVIITEKYARLIANGLDINDLFLPSTLSGGYRLEKKANKTCIKAFPELPDGTPFPNFSTNTIDTSVGVGHATDCINMLFNDVVDVFNKTVLMTMNSCDFGTYSIETLVPCGSDSIGNITLQCGAFSDMDGFNFIWLADAVDNNNWIGTVYTDDVGSADQIRASLDLCENLPVDNSTAEETNGAGDNQTAGGSGTQSSDASSILSLLVHVPLVALMAVGFMMVY